jgi:uncharacterized membrane protein
MFLYEIILLALSFGGLYIANKIRLEKKSGHKMVCLLDGNCEEVLNSDFAKVFGIPLELAGIGYYLTVILFNVLFLVFPALKFSLLEVILFGMTLFGFFFSLYLVSIQAFYLKNWCTWCLQASLFSTLIFIVSTISFYINLEVLVAVMKSMPWFFIALNIFAYALGTSLAIITEILTLKYLRDFKIDQKEKMTLMYLWQALWSVIFLVIISSFAIFVFDLHMFDNQRVYLIKSAIFGFIILASILMSLVILPKLDKSKIHCTVMHIFSLSLYRNLAIALSTMLLVSWTVNIFISQVFYTTCSYKKNIALYLVILFTSAALALIAFQYRDKKSLDKQK